jgi:hypothetical protein
VPSVTAPSDLHEVTFAYLADLLPGGTAAHYGVPPDCTFVVSTVDEGGAFERPVIHVIPTAVHGEQGEVWFMRPTDVIAKLALDGVPGGGTIVGKLLDKLTDGVKNASTNVLTFVPIVYEAGPTIQRNIMAKPQHARLTFSGVFGTAAAPLEIWSWSLTFAHKAALGGTTLQAATKARTLYSTSVAGLMPASVVLTKTRLALLSDGQHVTKLSDGSFDQGDDLVAVPGNLSGGQIMPLQTALCVSFSTTRQGAQGKGRAFLPFQRPLSAGFLVDSAVAAQFAGFGPKAIAEGMEGGSGPTLGAHSVISSFGWTSPVTSYRCGLVPDTMRSRRNALSEQYVVSAASA